MWLQLIRFHNVGALQTGVGQVDERGGYCAGMDAPVLFRNQKRECLRQHDADPLAKAKLAAGTQQDGRTRRHERLEVQRAEFFLKVAFGFQVKIGRLCVGAQRRHEQVLPYAVGFGHFPDRVGVSTIYPVLGFLGAGLAQRSAEGAKQVVARDLGRVGLIEVYNFLSKFGMLALQRAADERDHGAIARVVEELFEQVAADKAGSACEQCCFHINSDVCRGGKPRQRFFFTKVQDKPQVCGRAFQTVKTIMRILSAIFVYPIKSLGGIPLEAAVVQPRGLQYDRRWMLVDEHDRFVSQREVAALATLGTAIEPPFLVVFSKKKPTLRVHIPLEPPVSERPETTVQIWDDRCRARVHAPAIQAWFTEMLGASVRLVFMPDTTVRVTDPKYARAEYVAAAVRRRGDAVASGIPVSFSDGYPYLIIGQASLDDLNDRLAQPLPMDRFRPNFVFTGGLPYEEDAWEAFALGDTGFRGVKPCARCTITTTDQETGVRHAEPLKTLASYRQQGHRILFGQNVIWTGNGGGIVKIGMPLSIGC